MQFHPYQTQLLALILIAFLILVIGSEFVHFDP
jgi:hypothetical protein